MTLEDYFAASALQGLLANPNAQSRLPIEILAFRAYKLAKIMMEARQKND